MNYVTKLSTAIVVDRSYLVNLKSDELTKTMADIYSHNLPVRVVDSSAQFFSTKNLATVLEDEARRDDLALILEKRGVEFTPENANLIDSYQELKKKILSSCAAGDPSVTYPFAKVPDGWSVEDNLIIKKQSITRSGRNGTYSIGHSTLKKVWIVASSYWANISTDTRIGSIQASGYTRSVAISKSVIDIGCQQIQRYELEQLALHLGWEFPKEGVDKPSESV